MWYWEGLRNGIWLFQSSAETRPLSLLHHVFFWTSWLCSRINIKRLFFISALTVAHPFQRTLECFSLLKYTTPTTPHTSNIWNYAAKYLLHLLESCGYRSVARIVEKHDSSEIWDPPDIFWVHSSCSFQTFKPRHAFGSPSNFTKTVKGELSSSNSRGFVQHTPKERSGYI